MVNRCTKGSWTGVTEVAEIAVPRVVSSSQVGVDPFRYWWLGTLSRTRSGLTTIRPFVQGNGPQHTDH